MLDLENLKASDVLQAMVTGLLKSKNDPLFKVDMATFGKVEQEICYGCAASLTLVEMFGEGKLASEMMLGYAKTHLNRSAFAYAYTNLSDVIPSESSSIQESLPIDLLDLERAVDAARKGFVSSLIELLTGEPNKSFSHRWSLQDENWEEQLPKIEATIAEMATAGY